MLKNLRIAFFLATKSIIKGNRATTALIIFILSLAFVNLVFISSILNGIVDALNKQFYNNLVSNVVVEPQEEPTKKDFIFHATSLQEEIRTLPGVITTTRHYKLAGTVSFDKEKNGKLKFVSGEVVGIDPEQETKITGVSKKMVSGEYLNENDTDQVVLGSDLAGGYESADEAMSLGGVKVGDKVQITFSNGLVREYKVKGIFRVGFAFVDRIAFISAKEAESLLSVNDSASQVLVKIDSTGSENYFIDKIQPLVPNLKVKKWNDYAGQLRDVSKSFSMITVIISTIGLAVAAITIFILIYVEVVNKKRQIGILKAIGIKQEIIIYSYIFQALFFALSGVVIGFLSTFYLIVPFMASHPLNLPIGESALTMDKQQVISSTLSLMIASFIAGLIPSYLAVRQNILKAIWGS